jgi:hypothetical protein
LQSFKTPLLLLAALAVASCASVPDSPDASGRLIGTITYESSLGEYRIGLTSDRLERPALVRIGHLWHPFVRMYDADLKMRGAPFSVNLPAGDYRIAYWEVAQGQARTTSRTPIGIPVRVEKGRATYLGNLHFSSDWEASLREETARDLPILRARFPELAGMPIMSSIDAGTKRERVGGSCEGSLMGPAFSPWQPFQRGPLQVHSPASGAVRARFEAESSSDRFEPIESTLEYTDQRGFPCVRYRSAARDTRARISAKATANLRLEVLSLVCRLPGEGAPAFSASYSSRSETADPDFETAANSFIEGVRTR